MTILKLKAAQKDYLWGGRNLVEKFNKETDLDKLAETWEISAHKDGVSFIENGEYQGKLFTEYLKDMGNQVIGKNYNKDRFPILNKFIDAQDNLSIQVHPNDEYGLSHENDYGKTEMWYVIDAKPGSYLYYGLNKEVSKEEFAQAIDQGSFLDLLNKVEVKKGDVFFIEAGTIHAIGSGILIYEVQQNSNITYRVYDYKRKDKDGNERELHVDKAIEVSNLSVNKTYNFDNDNEVSKSLQRLVKSNYFDVLKGQISDEIYNINEESFQTLTIIDGKGTIQMGEESLEFTKGDSFFLPAQNGQYRIEGDGEFILSKLPWLGWTF